MKINIFLTVILLFPSFAFSMDTNLFNEMMDNLKSEKYMIVQNFLDKNHSKFSKDPEFYVILLNYSFKKGYKSGIVVAKGKAKEGDLEVRNKNTGEQVGFIGNRTFEDSEIIVYGISETQKAIKHFNNRLDIHFGIIHIAAKIKRWDILSSQLIEILSVSKTINNKWVWGPINSMEGDPKQFMIENIQAKVNELFYIGNEDADRALITVSEKMIEEYPEVIYGYSNLGVLYLANKKYALAEEYLTQAEKIDPGDEIVKGNLKKLREVRE